MTLRPTLWLATVTLFDELRIWLSDAKGECPKELRDKSEEFFEVRSKK
jgi:hypothetical protein